MTRRAFLFTLTIAPFAYTDSRPVADKFAVASIRYDLVTENGRLIRVPVMIERYWLVARDGAVAEVGGETWERARVGETISLVRGQWRQ